MNNRDKNELSNNYFFKLSIKYCVQATKVPHIIIVETQIKPCTSVALKIICKTLKIKKHYNAARNTIKCPLILHFITPFHIKYF